MLFQSLISQPLERGLRLGERSLPALVGGELLKDGRCKLFLLPVGEAGGGFECFPQGFRHGRDSALDGTKSRSTRSTSTVNICAERCRSPATGRATDRERGPASGETACSAAHRCRWRVTR